MKITKENIDVVYESYIAFQKFLTKKDQEVLAILKCYFELDKKPYKFSINSYNSYIEDNIYSMFCKTSDNNTISVSLPISSLLKNTPALFESKVLRNIQRYR